MLPHVEIPFLLCSYLPGIPLSLTFYFWLKEIKKEPIALLCFKSNEHLYAYIILFLYFFVLPLIIGILIDGLRHWIEEVAKKRKSVIPEDIFWPQYPKEIFAYNYNYNQDFLKSILSKHTVLYQLYEFSFNLFISLLVSILFLFSFNILYYFIMVYAMFIAIRLLIICKNYIHIFTILTLIAFLLLIPFVSLFSNSDTEINIIFIVLIFIFMIISFLPVQLFKNMYKESIRKYFPMI